MIPDIPVVGGDGIPFIQVNGTGVKLIQTIRPTNTNIKPIGIGDISDSRVWVIQPPAVDSLTVPVTTVVGLSLIHI